MNFIRNLVQQLQALWQQSSPTYRLAFVALSLSAVAVIGAVGYWSARPQYVALETNLSPSDASAIVSKLEAARIPHKLNFAASTVSVPKNRVSDARMAAHEILGPSASDDSSYRDSILSDPTQNYLRVIADKERALERTIAQMKSVAGVEVHVAVSEPDPFLRDRAATTAAVVVTPGRNVPFSTEHAATIAAMVSSSVESLALENVTVSTTDGRVVFGKSAGAGLSFSHQYEYQRRVEADKAAQAQTMLASMLGPGRAVVQVSAEIDFTELERIDEQLDPDSEVKTKETINSSTTTGSNRPASGVAGVPSNTFAASTPATSASPVSQNTESSETEYLFSKTIDTTRQPAGAVKRLTIAASVDLPEPDPNANPPVAAIDLTQVEQLIRNAVGFDEERGDTISVIEATLSGTPPGLELIHTLDRWEFYNRLARNASLGLGAIAALVLGFLLIRKMQPVILPGGSPHRTATERSSLVSELSRQAKDNPEIVSRVVAAWLHGDQPPHDQATGESPRPPAAAA